MRRFDLNQDKFIDYRRAYNKWSTTEDQHMKEAKYYEMKGNHLKTDDARNSKSMGTTDLPMIVSEGPRFHRNSQ